jgi:hypothetical protein
VLCYSIFARFTEFRRGTTCAKTVVGGDTSNNISDIQSYTILLQGASLARTQIAARKRDRPHQEAIEHLSCIERLRRPRCGAVPGADPRVSSCSTITTPSFISDLALGFRARRIEIVDINQYLSNYAWALNFDTLKVWASNNARNDECPILSRGQVPRNGPTFRLTFNSTCDGNF